MADLFVHSSHPQDYHQTQNQSSSSDVSPSAQFPSAGREQRRQETTSSYTSIGTTPDFETLLSEQADSGHEVGSNERPTSAGGMWGFGGIEPQMSPAGGTRFELSGGQHQQSSGQPQLISNQKTPFFGSNQAFGVPLSAPMQSPRFPGAGTLPRDRRRSSGLEQPAYMSGNTDQSQHQQVSQTSQPPVQQKQMYRLLPTGPGQEDPRYMSQERVMEYLQTQGILSSHVGEMEHQGQQHHAQQEGNNSGTGPYAIRPGTLSEAQQAAMFRAMMAMQQQQPGAQQKTPSNSLLNQDPGIWLSDDGDNNGSQRMQAMQPPNQHMELHDIEYDYNLGPSTAPPSLTNLDYAQMGQDISGYRFGQGHAAGIQAPQTAPVSGYVQDYSLEMQQQQMLGNQFSAYRSPHLLTTNISPGPSPLLAHQQLVQVPITDPGVESFDVRRLSQDQAHALVQAQLQAQMQMRNQYGTPAPNQSGFRNNLAVEAMIQRHSHQRNSSGASSYAGSVHSGLEGLEDQFLSATGLGQFTENAAEGYETSDFGGKEAAGLLDVEQFVDMDGGAGSVHSVVASKGSTGNDSSTAVDEGPGEEEPVFGIWTTVQGQHDSATNDQNLWQAHIDSGGANAGSAGYAGGHIMFAEPPPLTCLGGDNSGSEGMSLQAQQMIAPQRMMAALDASGTSEFGRRMGSISSTRTPSTCSSVSVSATNNAIPRTASPLSGRPNGTECAPPTRSTTVDSNDGFAMPPFPTQSASSGSGGSRSNSPIPLFNQPQRVKTLSGPQAKPHSPPQLFIPDTSSPSPSNKPVPLLPGRSGLNESMKASAHHSITGYTHQPGQMTLGIPTGGNMGGHTGSGSFLSPIGPGGPSINIVPSTPTSGLREARGIWEKLAIQAQQDQNAQNRHSGLSDQGPAATIPAPQGPPRRASHAGIYVPVTIKEGIALQNNAANQDMLPQPRHGSIHHSQFGLPGHMLVTPPLRQRTRSEGAISAMVADFALQDTQQQWLQQKQSDESIDPRMLMGESAMSSGTSTPGIESDDMQGMVFLGPNGVPIYVPRQGVLPGPEVMGANFIVTNDGRRLSFDSRLERASALLGPNANDPSAMRLEGGRLATHVKQEEFDGFLTSMMMPSDDMDQLRVAPSVQHRRQVKSEDWGRPAHMVDPSSHQLMIPEPQSSSRRGSLASSGSGSRGNSPSRPRDSSPYARPPINDSVPYPKQSPHVSPAKSTLSLQDSSSEASGNNGRRGKGSKLPNESRRGGGNQLPRAKVTTPATEMASRGRRTSDGLFECPVPGCGSTFTRQFNLKGHIRSHNEERPYKCAFEGCDKSFARQHDCKRHMQLHIGIKPFVCENCNRTFARLDALSRHHKTDSGAECAMKHPLPTNPDGSLMSESKYRAEMERRKKAGLNSQGPSLPTVNEGRKMHMKMEE